MVPRSGGLIRPVPGLSGTACASLASVFEATPGLERVVLYGSRAKGTHRPHSDIDLAIWGEASAEGVALRLEELPLPWIFDVRAYAGIRNAALRDHIDRVGIPVWVRSCASA